MAMEATPISLADDGCISYVFHQQKDDSRNFVLREQWRDEGALNAHFKHLVEVLGEPRPGGQLPASILDMCEPVDFKDIAICIFPFQISNIAWALFKRIAPIQSINLAECSLSNVY